MQALQYKYCRGCGKRRPVSEFGMNGVRLRSKCKDCISEYNGKKYRGEKYIQQEYASRPISSDGKRFCSKCRIEKVLDEFYNAGKNSKFPWCKACDRKRSREYQQALGKEERTRRKRSTWLSTAYGLTLKEYTELHDSQNGLCAVCRKPNIKDHFLCVDHDHKTGQIRGLLCHRCNRSVGFAQDDPKILRQLADYIEAANLIAKIASLIEATSQ